MELNKIKKSFLFSSQSDHLFIKASNRLKEIRATLALSLYTVSKYSKIPRNTIDRIENGEVSPSFDTLVPLILFYGFTLGDFFDFETPLPEFEDLKVKMKTFYEENGYDILEMVFSNPNLMDLIPENLIPNGYFDEYRTVAETTDYCETEYGYTYGNATNTLNNAVKKGWLIRDDKSKPKRYRKK
ncbi:helix-turn-helix domain-containing protein [Olivibacter sitiensis]|uniref:helix-turn-helix domain-containing protein n=1 Tax=Olivibacter sitiensis TaxID=376470 RepID=UPI0004814E82|nr:helix-turn-helix transcriptional regulator [Olivibacter sitiensis]